MKADYLSGVLHGQVFAFLAQHGGVWEGDLLAAAVDFANVVAVLMWLDSGDPDSYAFWDSFEELFTEPFMNDLFGFIEGDLSAFPLGDIRAVTVEMEAKFTQMGIAHACDDPTDIDLSGVIGAGADFRGDPYYESQRVLGIAGFAVLATGDPALLLEIFPEWSGAGDYEWLADYYANGGMLQRAIAGVAQHGVLEGELKAAFVEFVNAVNVVYVLDYLNRGNPGFWPAIENLEYLLSPVEFYAGRDITTIDPQEVRGATAMLDIFIDILGITRAAGDPTQLDISKIVGIGSGLAGDPLYEAGRIIIITAFKVGTDNEAFFNEIFPGELLQMGEETLEEYRSGKLLVRALAGIAKHGKAIEGELMDALIDYVNSYACFSWLEVQNGNDDGSLNSHFVGFFAGFALVDYTNPAIDYAALNPQEIRAAAGAMDAKMALLGIARADGDPTQPGPGEPEEPVVLAVNGITLVAQPGVLPPEVTGMSVTTAQVNFQIRDVFPIQGWNIQLLPGGLQPNGMVTVYLPIPSAQVANRDSLKVFYCEPGSSPPVEVDMGAVPVLLDGVWHMMFETGHFSLYALVDAGTEQPPAEEEEPAWWEKLPSFLQFILRWLCFGWVWMR